jgi:hypothetical protein
MKLGQSRRLPYRMPLRCGEIQSAVRSCLVRPQIQCKQRCGRRFDPAAEGSYDLRTNSKQQASQQSIWPERAFTNMNPVAIHAQSPEVQCPNCREALRLMRHIHLTGVPNIYVFYCQPCQFVETAAACG